MLHVIMQCFMAMCFLILCFTFSFSVYHFCFGDEFRAMMGIFAFVFSAFVTYGTALLLETGKNL